jgi:cytochrome d ubiquinol oxidase subunit I
MILAAYLTTSFVVGGIGALFLLQSKDKAEARIMLGMATMMAAIIAPLQIVMGDLQGLNTLKYQPVKVAAMEGLWSTQKGADLLLFAWPNEAEEKNYYEIKIPKLSSLILTHSFDGEVQGLKDWPKEDRPPVLPVFLSFRVMVGLGMAMFFMGLYSALQYVRGNLFSDFYLHACWVLMIPSGFIALLAGWFVTEIGRQPYTAYGVIRTIHSVSPSIQGAQVAWSLACFVLMYFFVFGAGTYYILKLIIQGIPKKNEHKNSFSEYAAV